MKITIKQLRKFIREQLSIDTKIGDSEIPEAGKGAFSNQYVKQGQLVSKWNNKKDKNYQDSELKFMKPDEKNEFEEFASLEDNRWYLSGDNAKYMNHSSDPNVGVLPGVGPNAKRERIALRDINKGEELTIDYNEVGTDGI